MALKMEDGELTKTDQETVDVLGHYFQEVFVKEDEKRGVPMEEEKVLGWDDSSVDFGISAVTKKLMKLQTDKSPGPDGIHPLLLKEWAASVAEPLSHIFQKSFELGTLPDDWKTVHVVPIFKKGSKTDKANYRPVSLTSVPCKIMESIIKDRMKKFLDSNGAISDAQHGFMQGRSCLTNLLETLENWTRALDEGYGIDVLYLDYRKAFDSVPIQRLIEKLKAYVISGNLLQWIESFLTLRTMRVGIRGSYSEWFEVVSGVPQGSVPGPLLFLLFVNDLPSWIVNDIKMFADDTKMWRRIQTQSDSQTLQADLDGLMNKTGPRNGS